MTGTGWEIWGVKAAALLTALVSGLIAVVIRLTTHGSGKLAHVDGKAGDEGED